MSRAQIEVLILNPFAVPRSSPGITRHADLVAGITDINARIISSSFGSVLGGRNANVKGFTFVPTPSYSSNGIRRLANWASYFAGSLISGSVGKRPSIVIASSPHLLSGLAGFLIARRWRSPFVLEVRDLWPTVLIEMGAISSGSRLARILEKLEKFLYRKADRIITLSEGAANYLVDMGVHSSRIVVMPNFSMLEELKSEVNVKHLRSKFGFDKPTFIYAGSHGPANGLEQLLPQLANSIDGEFLVCLVGDGVMKEELVSCAIRDNIPNLRFMSPVPKDQIRELLLAADFGLHMLSNVPVFEYGISPNKIFDYLAAGLPCVTTTKGEVAELIVDLNAGLVTSPEQLLSGLRQMVKTDSGTRRSMSEAGVHYSRGTGSVSNRREQLKELIDSLVTQK